MGEATGREGKGVEEKSPSEIECGIRDSPWARFVTAAAYMLTCMYIVSPFVLMQTRNEKSALPVEEVQRLPAVLQHGLGVELNVFFIVDQSCVAAAAAAAGFSDESASAVSQRIVAAANAAARVGSGSQMPLTLARVIVEKDEPFPAGASDLALDDWMDHRFPQKSGSFNLALLYSEQHSQSDGTLYLGTGRFGWRQQKCPASASDDHAGPFGLDDAAIKATGEALHASLLRSSTTRRVTRQRLSVTMLIQRDAGTIEWPLDQALETLLQPLARVSSAVEFEIDSQVVHDANIAAKMHRAKSGDFHYIRLGDLRRVVSVVGKGMSLGSTDMREGERQLHLVAFVPAQTISPLRITLDGEKGIASAVSVKGWGGITVVDRTFAGDAPQPGHEMRKAANAWCTIVREALGLVEDIQGTVRLPSTSGISQWEVDRVERLHLASFYGNAVSDLNSTISLVRTMTDMIIPSEVADYSQRVLSALRATTVAAEGGDIKEALSASKTASLYAARLHSLPSMVSELYFPPEHIAAVYLPIAAPLFAPIVSGYWKSWGRFKESKPGIPLFVDLAVRFLVALPAAAAGYLMYDLLKDFDFASLAEF
eukprot:g4456.t1